MPPHRPPIRREKVADADWRAERIQGQMQPGNHYGGWYWATEHLNMEHTPSIRECPWKALVSYVVFCGCFLRLVVITVIVLATFLLLW